MTKSKAEHRIHVILTAEEYNRLSAENEDTGVPMSAILRRAWLKPKPSKVPTPKQVKETP
jgi:hypothetical protein